MTPAVSARDASFHHAGRERPAFSGVTFTVERGEKVLLTGDSGAGKSTLLHAIAGLAGGDEEGALSGELRVDGTVGMVLQDPDAQVVASRVGDDVAFGCENLGVPREEIWRRVRKALGMVGLDVALDHPTARLSGGQKQRLALAGVLAMGADIIILDEPTANLDPEGARAVRKAVDHVCEATGATLIVVEHRPSDWVPQVDTIFRLDSSGLHEVRASDLPGPPDVPPSQSVPDNAPWLVRATELRTAWGAPRTLTVPQGYSTVLLGANGVGKTTLAATLAGIIRPEGGHLEYAEALRQGLRTPPHTWKSKELTQRVGFVFQNPEHQFVARTVREEMDVSGAPRARQDALLERLRLAHLLDFNPFTLSGGEKRRLSVATALVNAPELVVLDEPTFGQDNHTFVELVGLIRELTDQGRTVISITHDEHYVCSLGDQQVVLT